MAVATVCLLEVVVLGLFSAWTTTSIPEANLNLHPNDARFKEKVLTGLSTKVKTQISHKPKHAKQEIHA
jgi:hypothetical protein